MLLSRLNSYVTHYQMFVYSTDVNISVTEPRAILVASICVHLLHNLQPQGKSNLTATNSCLVRVFEISLRFCVFTSTKYISSFTQIFHISKHNICEPHTYSRTVVCHTE